MIRFGGSIAIEGYCCYDLLFHHAQTIQKGLDTCLTTRCPDLSNRNDGGSKQLLQPSGLRRGGFRLLREPACSIA